MKFRTSLLLLGAIMAIACATFLVAVAFIDDPEPSDTTTEQPPPETDTQFEAEALEAAEIMTTWKPAEDYNRTDAELRAAHLMTDEMANSIESPERQASGQDWFTAAEADATSQPQVEINQYTQTEEGTVSVFATWQWVTESGETLADEPQERIYYFAFNDQGKIHDYTYETVRSSQLPETGN